MAQLTSAWSPVVAVVLAGLCTHCSSSGSSGPGTQAAEDAGAQSDASTNPDEKPALGSELGTGDGSASSVTFTVLYDSKGKYKLSDLGFHETRAGELWIVDQKSSSVVIGTDVSGPSQAFTYKHDPAASHFMFHPPAIAIGVSDTWATCGDGETTPGGAENFIGPTLFSSDPAIFAKPTPGGLGSHLDMLHSTPNCRGIEHDSGNLYWAFNAFDKSIDRYQFNKDHGPGHDDHSDGEIYRYVAGQVFGAADDTPSHLALDSESGWLYVCDTGNKRIVRLNTKTGTPGATLPRQNELAKARKFMDDAVLEEFIAPGTFESPSGIEIHDGGIYVSDAATGTFYALDMTGKIIRKLETGRPAGSLAGFTFGADDKIYFADRVAGQIVRIDVNP